MSRVILPGSKYCCIKKECVQSKESNQFIWIFAHESCSRFCRLVRNLLQSQLIVIFFCISSYWQQSLCEILYYTHKKLHEITSNAMSEQKYFFSKHNVYDMNIWDALHVLVPFVQSKKRKKHPWRSVTFDKIAGFCWL